MYYGLRKKCTEVSDPRADVYSTWGRAVNKMGMFLGKQHYRNVGHAAVVVLLQ